MAQTFTSTLHLSSGSAAANAVPISMVIWVNTTGGQNRRFFELLASGSDTNLFGVALDITGTASNKIAAYRSSSSSSNQALSASALTTSTWQHAATVFTTVSSVASYLNGANKGTSSSSITPSGINATLISGRGTDFSFGIAGQAAHAAVWSRALSDNEVAYLGIGGNPRAIKSCVSYWKLASGASPVPDEIGTNNLTASGTLGAGTSDPNFQSFMTGGPVGAQSYTQAVAITPINLAAGGPIFDDVSSAFTVVLSQLAAPSQPTTTSSALTAVREVLVGSVTAFTAGDYMKITSGGTPTRVLGVNASTNTLLVADDQTYATSAQVFRFAVNPLTISGLSITSNVLSGTPTAAGTNSLCLFRASCNGLGSLMADSDVFTITVASGGGGGGGLQMPAGAFCGGFVGG